MSLALLVLVFLIAAGAVWIAGIYLSNTTQVYPEDRGQNYSLILGEKVATLMDEDSRTASIDRCQRQLKIPQIAN